MGRETRRTASSRWSWPSSSGSASDARPGQGTGDATSVKEALERVACFVGYVRLMNFGNEALAELDASKVVTQLFGAGRRNTTTSGWNWFG